MNLFERKKEDNACFITKVLVMFYEDKNFKKPQITTS